MLLFSLFLCDILIRDQLNEAFLQIFYCKKNFLLAFLINSRPSSSTMPIGNKFYVNHGTIMKINMYKKKPRCNGEQSKQNKMIRVTASNCKFICRSDIIVRALCKFLLRENTITHTHLSVAMQTGLIN